MPTLFQMLVKKKEAPKVVVEKPQEQLVTNPFNILIGNHIKIDTVDTEKYDYATWLIRELMLQAGEREFPWVDYGLIARPFGGDPVKSRLRLVPAADADGQYTHDMILLNFVADFAYDKDYHVGLGRDKNPEGIAEEGDDRFWRVNDMKTEWVARTKTLQDEDHSGKVDANEVRSGWLTIWDFWRETDKDGQTVQEFYYVEMDGRVRTVPHTSTDGSGKFEVWRGFRIDPVRVTAI